MVTHAATVIKKRRKDDERFTAYRRWKRREFTKPVAEFGEKCDVLAGGIGREEQLRHHTGMFVNRNTTTETQTLK